MKTLKKTNQKLKCLKLLNQELNLFQLKVAIFGIMDVIFVMLQEVRWDMTCLWIVMLTRKHHNAFQKQSLIVIKLSEKLNNLKLSRKRFKLIQLKRFNQWFRTNKKKLQKLCRNQMSKMFQKSYQLKWIPNKQPLLFLKLPKKKPS